MKQLKVFVFFTIIFYNLFSFNYLFAYSNLYFDISSNNIKNGDRFTLYLKVDSLDKDINAISSKISYPENLLKIINISKDKSIINLWVGEPNIKKNEISFEGVILNPGFRGKNGLVLKIIFEAKNEGEGSINFTEGFALANDGLGTNVLAKLNSIKFNISKKNLLDNLYQEIEYFEDEILKKEKIKLPVITDFSKEVLPKSKLYIYGNGEPNALTKIIFRDKSLRSLGEEFLTRIQRKKIKLDQVLVENDENGNFKYEIHSNLIAGVYDAVPFLVDKNNNIEEEGKGVQFFIEDSNIIKKLIILINILVLLIPIVILLLLIYFIPWYSFLRMKIIKKKLGFEEEKITLEEKKAIRNESKENILEDLEIKEKIDSKKSINNSSDLNNFE